MSSESKEQLIDLTDPVVDRSSPLPLTNPVASPSHSSFSPNHQSNLNTSSPLQQIQVRPSYPNMFKPRLVESMLKSVVEEYLKGKSYDQNETSNWTKELATIIKGKLKEYQLQRYKYLVQVIIGECRGAGVRSACRCLWDQQTDKMAEATYQNVKQKHRNTRHSDLQRLLLTEKSP